MKKEPYKIYFSENKDKMVALGFIPKGDKLELIALMAIKGLNNKKTSKNILIEFKKRLIESVSKGFNVWKQYGGADKDYEDLICEPRTNGIKSSDYPIIDIAWEDYEHLNKNQFTKN